MLVGLCELIFFAWATASLLRGKLYYTAVINLSQSRTGDNLTHKKVLEALLCFEKFNFSFKSVWQEITCVQNLIILLYNVQVYI